MKNKLLTIRVKIKSKLLKCERAILYSVLFILGVVGIIVSFFLTGNCSSVFSGVGTGLLTSLVVSVIINKENDSREKREKQAQKRYLVNGIVESSLDVYEDVLHRINEYITITESAIKPIYRLYNDFKPFNGFAKYLESISLNTLSETETKRLNTLFNFRNYRIDYLIAELKHLPKQEYFLRGILTEEECSNLLSNTANDAYMSYAQHIEEFWNDDEILNMEKCIHFLRMTIYICSNTISSFDFAKIQAKIFEKNLKDQIDQLYYDEVYSQSEAYMTEQIERANDEAEYYANHPDELEKLQKQYEEWENETEEDRTIRDLHCCICGISAYSIDEILEKLEPDSEKVKSFFQREEVISSLKKKRKLRKAIANRYGQDYLKNNSEKATEENDNGQA